MPELPPREGPRELLPVGPFRQPARARAVGTKRYRV